MSDVKEHKAPVKMVRGIVERGRTVCVPRGKKVIGHLPETNTPVFGPTMVHYTDGHEVSLPEEEMAWLRERGFIVDPNKKAPPPSDEEGARVSVLDKSGGGASVSSVG